MRRATLCAIAALFLAACADPMPPTSGEPPGRDTTRLDVYETMIRHLSGQEPFDWSEVIVVRRICADAGEPTEHPDCDGGFTSSEQTALLGRLEGLAPIVRFIDDPTPLYDADWVRGKPDRIVIWLGPIVEEGPQVQVAGGFGCGGLCGSGSTYVLQLGERGWRVTGTTGGGWIA